MSLGTEHKGYADNAFNKLSGSNADITRAVPRIEMTGFKEISDPDDTQKLLNTRQDTHGDFLLVSKISQDIKEAIRWAPKEMATDKREALEMIAVKIARICIGNQNEKDHWKDIIGYATLALNRIK
jgi:hypothetical protein